MNGSTRGALAPMRRVTVITAIAVQLAVLATVVPISAGAASPSCRATEKGCVMIGEPPVPGVYKFKSGTSGARPILPGRLTIVKKTAATYVVRDFRMWLGQKEGCTLNGHLAKVKGVFQLRKKTKVIGFDNGTKEIKTTWRVPHTKVKVKAGGKVYPGTLFAAPDGTPPGFGLPPSITGSLTLTTQEGIVCGGSFRGEHRGRP